MLLINIKIELFCSNWIDNLNQNWILHSSVNWFEFYIDWISIEEVKKIINLKLLNKIITLHNKKWAQRRKQVFVCLNKDPGAEDDA